MLIENVSVFDGKLTEMLLKLCIDFLMHLFPLNLCTCLLLALYSKNLIILVCWLTTSQPFKCQGFVVNI